MSGTGTWASEPGTLWRMGTGICAGCWEHKEVTERSEGGAEGPTDCKDKESSSVLAEGNEPSSV